MAIEYPGDKTAGVWAIKVHQAIWGTAAPSATWLDTSINSIQGNGLWAWAKSFTSSKAFKAEFGSGKSFNYKYFVKTVYKCCLDRKPTKYEINKFKDLAPHKILKKILNDPHCKEKLDGKADAFLQKAAAGTAVYGVDLCPPNQPPTDISISMNMVNENALLHTVIGELSATDPNEGDTFTFRILDANSPFAIFGNKLTVADPSQLDFEAIANGKLWVNVEVTDSHGKTYVEAIEIQVKDVEEKSIIASTNQVDVLQGTVQADVFIANVNDDYYGVNTTANAGDHAIGGAGTDTYHLFVDGTTHDGVVDGIVLHDVEIAKVTNLGEYHAVLDASKFKGTTTFESHTSKGDVEFRNIGKQAGTGNGTTISGVHTKGNIYANYAWGTLNGANDVVNVHLDGFGEKCIGNHIWFSQDHDYDYAQIEAINLVTEGKVSHLSQLIVGSDLKKLTISGTGELIIGTGTAQSHERGDIRSLIDDNPNLQDIDASGMKANIDIRIDGLHYSVYENDFDGSYKGGSANDTIRLGDAPKDGHIGTIDGGAGNNRVVLWDFGSVPVGSEHGGKDLPADWLKNIQVVEFEGPVGGSYFGERGHYNAKLDLNNLSGVQTIKLRDFYTWNSDDSFPTVASSSSDDDYGYGYSWTYVNFVNIDDDSTIKVQICDPEVCDDGKSHADVPPHVKAPLPFDPCYHDYGQYRDGRLAIHMDFDFGSKGFDEGWETWEEGRDHVCLDLERNDINVIVSGNEIDELEINVTGGSFRQVTLSEDLWDLSRIEVNCTDKGTVVIDGDYNYLRSLTEIDASGAGTTSVVIRELHTENNLKITTSEGDDYVEGSYGNDYIRTNGGSDKVLGLDGDDKLDAGAGRDCVAGGYGKDIVNGGAGADCMWGGDFYGYGDYEKDTFIIDVDQVKHLRETISNAHHESVTLKGIDFVFDFETDYDVLDFVGNAAGGSAHNFLFYSFGEFDYATALAEANTLFLGNSKLDYIAMQVSDGDDYGVVVFSESRSDDGREVDEAVFLVGQYDVAAGNIIGGVA